MKVLVVEDEPKIKTEAIDDCLSSLGHVSEWAQNQQDANAMLAVNEYDLILLDLQIPSRSNGKASAEFGKNLLNQIRARKGRAGIPVILMTAQHQDCVDLLTDLQEIGIDGSISKPFPPTGRTLAVVIEEVLDKYRRSRVVAQGNKDDTPLAPFTGGVLGYHPHHIELCGETIARDSQRGYAWRILQLLREKNDRGNYLRYDSAKLANTLESNLAQNTVIRSIKGLRDRITTAMARLGYNCKAEAVIANGGQGYHLTEGIHVEVFDDDGTCVGHANESGNKAPNGTAATPPLKLDDKQRWVIARLASNGSLTRQDVENEFNISGRTAKRVLGEMSNASIIEFDRATHPGCYRLK